MAPPCRFSPGKRPALSPRPKRIAPKHHSGALGCANRFSFRPAPWLHSSGRAASGTCGGCRAVRPRQGPSCARRRRILTEPRDRTVTTWDLASSPTGPPPGIGSERPRRPSRRQSDGLIVGKVVAGVPTGRGPRTSPTIERSERDSARNHTYKGPGIQRVSVVFRVSDVCAPRVSSRWSVDRYGDAASSARTVSIWAWA